jgi:hypothetical protein
MIIGRQAKNSMKVSRAVIVPEYTSLAANFLRFQGSSDWSSFVHRGSHNEFCG